MTDNVQRILLEYGQKGYAAAKNSILKDTTITNPTKQVLRYFLKECWPNRQHPALVSLSCQAIGTNTEAADDIGAAIVLLTGAADMHDDIVDRSKRKGPILTAYGKFGSDLVLLTGDILILKATTQLAFACNSLSDDASHLVLCLVDTAFSEIGCATAKEREYKGSLTLDPQVYRKIIRAKGSVSEACTRIGAIIGGGSKQQVDGLGHFGRTLSVLMTLQNEFADMRNSVELRNRWENEVLPLPLFYAFQNEAVKTEVLGLLEGRINKETTGRIWELVMAVEEVKGLIHEMQRTAVHEKKMLSSLVKNREPFNMLLGLSTEQVTKFANVS